jgi:hypothetical protein
MNKAIPPRTFVDAVLRVMKNERLPVKAAIARARSVFPDLYASDRALTRNFTDRAWFDVVAEARALAADQNISLEEAFSQVYRDNPALAAQLLGREQL